MEQRPFEPILRPVGSIPNSCEHLHHRFVLFTPNLSAEINGCIYIYASLLNFIVIKCSSAIEEMGKDDSSPGAGSESPSKFNFSLWARCLLGPALSFFLPIWKGKWANLMRIEGEAEMVVEVAENAAEVVEKVATVAENVAAEEAEKFPDYSSLKKAAMVVEHVSEIAAKDAHSTAEFIHQGFGRDDKTVLMVSTVTIID
ncbi:uncharacterized protein LOC120171548 [Hibiscus syriacus]|uniref:uncharacterized protein LOC120171548 n=1 Tax=Hibiscus syriacus TaxID=106335 RepID=UPI001924C216|nr:uncharacterized protein LOC120171548 [Hibiscus syriacus]